MRVLLITSGQPTLNPRLVKEADALTAAGYQVTVLFAYWNAWGDQYSKQLLQTKKWNAAYTGGHPVQKPVTYFVSRLLYKAAQFLISKTGLINFFAETAASRSSFFLIRAATKHKADIYIGHNLGALAATVKAAKKHQAKCGFDAEDFHRNEINDAIDSYHYKLVKHLEDKYFPELNYLTASSTEITSVYKQLYPFIDPVTLLNVFPKTVGIASAAINLNKPLRLFWFSQTIGPNRGLEDITGALKQLPADNYELHLLGYISESDKRVFIQSHLQGIENIHFYPPKSPNELVGFAAQFDIGLALEPGFCINNNLALSNKIFTYLQAGLAIVVSDTTAQKSFILQNPQIGNYYKKGDVTSLAGILAAYVQNRESLSAAKNMSFKTGQEKLNWEFEQIKFLLLVKDILED